MADATAAAAAAAAAPADPAADAVEAARLDAAMARLRGLLRELGAVLVAFSGGVDSALLVQVAWEELGEAAVALTAASPTFPPEELAETERIAAALGITHILVDSNELDVEGYAANQGDRCYFCKRELFELARAEARSRGIPWVLDGTITDDLGDHRPGLVAAGEARVRHPLVEAGFDKAMVRAAARRLGLPVWDKPAFACLGSRFPVGTRVTAARVRQVQRIESLLRTFGIRQLRARWHELEGQPLLRVELGPEEFALVADPRLRQALVEAGRAEGFRWVTVDLAGYQRGGLSHALGPAEGGEPST